MTQPQDVQVESSPTADAPSQSASKDFSDLDHLFSDEAEDAAPQEEEVEQEAVADESALESPPKEELKAKDEEKQSSGAEKRIKQLLAKNSEKDKVIFEGQKTVELYTSALEMLQEQYNALQTKLSQYEEVDPRLAKLEQMEFQQRLRQKQEELEKSYAEKLSQTEINARAEVYKEQILEQIHGASTKYEGVTPQDIALAMRHKSYNGESPEQIAAAIHKSRESIYAKRLRESAKPAPKPLSQKGQVQATKKPQTKEELAAAFERDFGRDFFG